MTSVDCSEIFWLYHFIIWRKVIRSPTSQNHIVFLLGGRQPVTVLPSLPVPTFQGQVFGYPAQGFVAWWKCKVVSVAPQSYREYAILLMDFIVFITPGCFLRITTIPSGLASGAWRIPVLQLDRRGFHPSDWVGNFECFCGVFTSSLGYGVAPRWMPCRAPVRCITTLSVLERLQHMEQLHLQVFRPVFGKNICIYDYSARKQRMALWESAAEGLWISSQLKVMFKGPEALGWFGGKLQYHAILRWKKGKKTYGGNFGSDTKTCETICVEHKAWRFVDRKKKADVRPT